MNRNSQNMDHPVTADEALLQLMEQNSGSACISIVMPLYLFTADQGKDQLHAEKIINRVKQELDQMYPQAAEVLINDLHSLFKKLRIPHEEQGIGVYISLNLSYYTSFPFPVMERIQVSDHFAIRELLYKNQYALPYFVLILDEKTGRLFTGRLNHVQEIKDENFPILHDYKEAGNEPTFTANKPVIKTLRERSELKKVQFETFLHLADDLLDQYAEPESLMIVCGVRRYTSAFLNRSRHINKLVSVIHGSYEGITESQLAAMSWPVIKTYLDKKLGEYLAEFLEKMGEGRAEEGIYDVWEAVAEGRGALMLVEKDYQETVYLEKGNDYKIHLHPPRRTYQLIPDAVHELVQKLNQTKGKVVFVENGMLRDHQHITLITRY